MSGTWEYEIVVHHGDLNANNEATYDQAMIVRRRKAGSGHLSDFARGRVGERVTPWLEFCWADRRGAQDVIDRLRAAEITPAAIEHPANPFLQKEVARLTEELAGRDQELREMQALMNDQMARFLALEATVSDSLALYGETMEELAAEQEYVDKLEQMLKVVGSAIPARPREAKGAKGTKGVDGGS